MRCRHVHHLLGGHFGYFATHGLSVFVVFLRCSLCLCLFSGHLFGYHSLTDWVDVQKASKHPFLSFYQLYLAVYHSKVRGMVVCAVGNWWLLGSPVCLSLSELTKKNPAISTVVWCRCWRLGLAYLGPGNWRGAPQPSNSAAPTPDIIIFRAARRTCAIHAILSLEPLYSLFSNLFS